MNRPPLPFRTLRAMCGLAALALAAAVSAAPVRTEHVEAELVAAKTALVPGEPLTVALRLAIDKGWHTYWRNPGDSGLPTTLEWKLPGGVSAGPIEWPAPHLLPAGPLLNYGYENEVLHLVTLTTAPDFLSGRDVTIAARADWLVCKEICIPEGADLTLTLPVANSADPDPRWGQSVAVTRAALPRPLARWQASAEGRGTTIALKFTPPAGAADPGEVRYFANTIDRIEPSAPQPLAREGGAYVLTLPVATTLRGPFGNLAGVVTAANGFGDEVRAATIDVAVSGAVSAPARAGLPPPTPSGLAVAPADTGGFALAIALASAFIGGMLLNLMPCVFPVLSLKVLGFATHDDPKATLHHEAVAFALGVVLTFVALGLLLSALRAAGEQLGWGFQLQSPAVVTALAMLFFVLALNLSGVFEFGQLAPSSVAEWSSKNRTVDAFGSGVLAVVIASPCTAPFMGAALGFALAGGVAMMLAVFVALGIGMALPYVLLAWFPGWRSRLPRSGPWLARFKQLLAFPLYATVIWLAWVLGAQQDNDAVLRLFVVLLGVGFALWAWRIVRGGGARSWGIAGLAVLAGALTAAWPLFARDTEPARISDASAPSTTGDWLPFSQARVEDFTAAGRPVFVDFTAAWCVTCQVNKRLVLNSDIVREGFAKRHVALVRADWTRRDPAITRALTALGRSGVPVYVLHRPGKAPLLLPEVLQQQTVLDALSTL